MPNPCSDISKLVPTYLDGELAESELLSFEHHVAECDECHREVEDERRFLERIRESLAAPPASDTLRARLSRALDVEEERAQKEARRERRSWVLPGAATLAAAAALLVFVFDVAQPASNDNQIAQARLAAPSPALDVEPVSRGDIARSAREYLRMPVRAPRFASADAALRGWQPIRSSGHDTALFVYEVRHGSESHRLEVQTLDARNLDLGSAERRVVRGTEVWVAKTPGVSSVSYRDPSGVGYIFTSYMDTDELVNLVVQSDLVARVNQRLRDR